ncbi:MAG: L-threonylcarbamoyladenylate synthase [Bermanella sp.]|jgi:L-threonylcarbamoyladenylate synthase
MRWPIYKAKHALETSGVIVYPTETVWGLGCDPFDEEALNRILDIKRRDAYKGLILVGANIQQFDFLLNDIAAEKRAELESRWPGPFTYLVPHKDMILPLVYGRFDTVAIRVSSHPMVQQLCKQFGGPIVSTSANYSGQPTVRNAVQARLLFGSQVDFILSGPVGLANGPSKIVDLETGRVIRK